MILFNPHISISDALYRPYRWLRYRLRRLQYREPISRCIRLLNNDSHTLRVADTTVDFHMLTRAEHRRFKRLTPSERPIFEDLLERVEPDDVFYDVGANIGVYTCLLAKHVGQVIAFEPEPETRARAEANLRLNGLSHLASVKQWALSDSPATLQLLRRGEQTVGEGQYTLTTEPTDETITVDAKVGDRLIAEGVIAPPNVLKIDVEGSEDDVLDGLQETLSNPDCRLVYCEVHPEQLETAGTSVDAVSETLERAGFEVTRLLDRYEEYFLRGLKPDR